MEKSEVKQAYNLAFEKREADGLTRYVFKNVVIKVDTTGKNNKILPELIFSTFDKDPYEASVNQPDKKRENVDMNYISACIKEVSKYTGIKIFWFYPNGEDAFEGDLLEEEKEKRQQARLRLFGRYFNITPASDGKGYIMKI